MHGTLGVVSFFVCFLPTWSSAATYYVAKTGSNSNSCSQAESEGTPKLTIQAGINCQSGGGNIVIVKAGTYNEAVTSWVSGTSGNLNTLRANTGDTVTWTTPNTDPASQTGMIAIFDKSYIRIEGFTFQNAPTRGTLRILNSTGNKSASPIVGIEIVNNTFINNGHNNSSGTGGSSYIVHMQAVGRENAYAGSTPLNTISGNTFTNNYGNNITMSGSSDFLIDNNVSTGTKGAKNIFAGNNYDANCIGFFGATINSIAVSSWRNIARRNRCSNIIKDAYVETSVEGSGVRMDVGNNLNVVEDNVFWDILTPGTWDFTRRAYGVYIENNSNNNIIRRNVIYNIGESCYGDGSWPTSITAGNQFINNVGHNCGQVGLALIHSSGTVVKNNIFTGSVKAQIYVSDLSVKAGGHIFRNNNYWKSGTALIGKWNGNPVSRPYDTADLTLNQWKSLTGESGTLSVDPRFTNPPSDFHLQADSPVKGAGEQGLDMGAYPVTPSLPAPTNLQVKVQ